MKNIKNILFDCDGVLYQDLESVFGQVSKRMTQYISEKLKINLVEAKKLQTEYFHKYNTSLNGSSEHVNNITTHLGIDDLFEDVFDIVDAEYSPKPAAKAFDLMVKKFDIDPKETIYIEDIAKNLSIGKERGATTVWLINNEYWGKKESDKDYIDYKIENLSLFLKEIRLLKNS